MVPSPTQSKAPWRPEGWFSERQEKILVNRILRDDPTKSDMHNRQAVTPVMIWQSLRDFDLWPQYLIGLSYHVPSKPPDQYLTLILRGLGFDTFETNLLSIPAQVASALLVRHSRPHSTPPPPPIHPQLTPASQPPRWSPSSGSPKK